MTISRTAIGRKMLKTDKTYHIWVYHISDQMQSLTDFLKTFSEGANRTVSGREFQSLGAEHEKEPS